MPPRLTLYQTARSFCLRSRPLRGSFIPLAFRSQRTFAESKDPKGSSEDVLPHVSEEAAKTGEITGDAGPEIEQGTPVIEVYDKSELQSAVFRFRELTDNY